MCVSVCLSLRPYSTIKTAGAVNTDVGTDVETTTAVSRAEKVKLKAMSHVEVTRLSKIHGRARC